MKFKCNTAYLYLSALPLAAEEKKEEPDADIHTVLDDSNSTSINQMNGSANNDGNLKEENKVEMTDLPDDILQNIREFVSINALLLLVNRHFHAMKGRLHYYELTEKYSLKYHASEAFRKQVKK